MGSLIKTYICQTKCFHQNRVWNPGEKLESETTPPKHFVTPDKYKADPKMIVPKDPKSFAEFNKREQEAALRAVGHGKPAKPAIPGMPAAPQVGEENPFA